MHVRLRNISVDNKLMENKSDQRNREKNVPIRYDSNLSERYIRTNERKIELKKRKNTKRIKIEHLRKELKKNVI